MSRSYLSFALDAVDRLYFALNSAGITTERTLELDREEVNHLVGAGDRETLTLLCDVLLSDVIVDCGRRAYDLCGDEFISMVEQRMSAAARAETDEADATDEAVNIDGSVDAVLHAILGCAYLRRGDGLANNDTETGIRHLEAVTRLVTRPSDESRLALCMIRQWLGTLYPARGRGRRSQNMARAVEHCLGALALCDRKEDLCHWAEIQCALALAYIGSGASGVETAIEHLQAGLDAVRRSDNPRMWAQLQHRLAVAYFHRDAGDIEFNQDATIECLTAAADALADAPRNWERVTILHQLGRAYFTRIAGDIDENVSRAVRALEAACDIAKSLDQPAMLAEIQLMLARAYCHRRDGGRRCDLERAVSCYRQALRGFSRQTWSDMTSTIQEELEHAKRLLADDNLRASDDAHRIRGRVDLAGEA